MIEPTFDKGGYPTEETLEHIQNWPLGDAKGLIEFCTEAWSMEYGSVRKKPSGTFHFVTGGWSGNESIIVAMQAHPVFWSIYWLKSERGGLYVFTVEP